MSPDCSRSSHPRPGHAGNCLVEDTDESGNRQFMRVPPSVKRKWCLEKQGVFLPARAPAPDEDAGEPCITPKRQKVKEPEPTELAAEGQSSSA